MSMWPGFAPFRVATPRKDKAMRLLRVFYLATMLAGMLMLAVAGTHTQAAAAAQGDTPTVKVITFDADVNPVTASYVDRGIAAAERDGAAALVILLTTP